MNGRKKRFTPKAALALLLVVALNLSACGKTPEEATTEQSSVEESFSAESSAGEKENEKEAESEPVEEVAEPSADFLTEIQETEMYEISLASYNSDYKVGDTVIITVEMECAADFAVQSVPAWVRIMTGSSRILTLQPAVIPYHGKLSPV